jgi:AcrR family transcriptional regulator
MAEMQASKEPAPRWHRRPEARPDEILAAALDVFGEQGFVRAKLDDIARRAGISKGTLYLYFDSKETIFREMVRARMVASVVAGEEMVRSHQGTSRELLIRLARKTWSAVNDPQLAKIIRLVHSEIRSFPELARFYFDEVIARNRRVLETAVSRGIASGEFRPVDPQATARAIPILLVHSAQFQCFFCEYDSNALPDERMFAGILDLLLNGVLAHQDEPQAS